MFSPSCKGQKSGFTLLELLLVIGIVALLAVAVTPAFNAISSSHGVGQGAHDVAGLLELARSEAVARQTYVWVGFQNTNMGGTYGIVAGAVFSRDGSGTNTNSSNLAGLSRAIQVRGVALTNWSGMNSQTTTLLKDEVSSTAASGLSSVASSSSGLNFTLGKAAFADKHSITFSPSGEAMLNASVTQDDGFVPYIDVSLKLTRGGYVDSDAEDASVIVDGATGNVRILRVK